MSDLRTTDQALAELFANEPNPIERLSLDQSEAISVWHTGTLSVDVLLKHGRLVRLTCGHFVVTKTRHRAGCPRCGEMIRTGWDYDAFRNLGAPDTFTWPGDPLVVLHENQSSGQDAFINKASPV